MTNCTLIDGLPPPALAGILRVGAGAEAVFTCAIAVSLIVGAPALKDRVEPDKPPAGEWKIEGAEFDGVVCRVLNTDHAWVNERSVEIGSRHRFGFLLQYSAVFYRVNDEHRADLTYVLQPDKPPERAIWKVEGDRLTICIGASGKPPPTDYTAAKGSGRALYVLRRVGD